MHIWQHSRGKTMSCYMYIVGSFWILVIILVYFNTCTCTYKVRRPCSVNHLLTTYPMSMLFEMLSKWPLYLSQGPAGLMWSVVHFPFTYTTGENQWFTEYRVGHFHWVPPINFSRETSERLNTEVITGKFNINHDNQIALQIYCYFS